MDDQQQLWQTWRTVAETAALEAGALIRHKLAEPRTVASKGFRDLVTDADYAAQQCITELVRARFPDHSFLAEERDATLPRAGSVQWIVDPVDGTSNYSRGIPNFCVSVAVAANAQVIVGVTYDPMREELFSGVRGQGCTLNGQPVTVSPTASLADAIVSLDWGRRYEVRQASLLALLRFAHAVRSIRAIGSAALALAWVAAGRLDAYINFSLSAWDIAAGMLLIEEAGGAASDLGGLPLPLAESTTCLGANRLLQSDLLALIQAQE
jgi:myo-inositol-1(or 4)-monophosphatase